MTSIPEHTHLAVIGAGPGGYAAAFLAADRGLNVALIDPEPNPGGVCLFRGCIPSKALLHIASVIAEAEEAAQWGVAYDKPKIDPVRVNGWKQDVVNKLTGGLGQLCKPRKVNYIRARASFAGGNILEIKPVDGGEGRIRFDNAIIATGSKPAMIGPLMVDSPRLMDSTAALEVNDVPPTLLVIGGGYIGLELGTVYAALGSKVTVVEMLPGLLPGADRDLVAVLSKRLMGRLEAVLLKTTVTAIKVQKNGLKVTLKGESGEESRLFDKVLMAVGRKPVTDGLNLDAVGIKVNEKGFIPVDPQRRTSVNNIYAIGDVVGEPMLAHKAAHEAKAAVEAALGAKASFDPRAIPAVVYTDPEVAWCGLTEAQAKESGWDFNVAKFPWGASGRALSIGRTDGLTKIVVERKTQRILGVGIVGRGAGDLISEAVLAMEMGATVDDLRLTIHPHPTLSETLMEAADVFFGESTHIFKPKRD